MRTVAELTERLGVLHRQTQETPLFNPVFQLSHDLSRELESGEIDLSALESMIAELECEALMNRAGRLQRLVAPVATEANDEALDRCIRATEFEAFREAWEHPQLHAVFTAHPTFLLAPAQSEAVATAAASEGAIGEAACAAPSERPTITLAYEHGRAMAAMAQGQDARDRIVSHLLDIARERWPEEWHALSPLPFRFATWVGYDMDGRTDIGWHTSIGFRLAEKAERLARYVASLEAIDPAHSLLTELRPAA